MNKNFYIVGIILLALALGAAYVLSGGSDDVPPAPAPTSDPGIRIIP